MDPQRNPRRLQSYNSIASNRKIPKQYRVLGLASPDSSTTLTPSIVSSSATIRTPAPLSLKLSDYLSNLVKHITHYFDLVECLPLKLIDYNLHTERPSDTFSTHPRTETEFARCLSGLRDTLWSIQAQLKDEDAIVRKVFRTFGKEIKKYLIMYLKGWRRGMFMRSSCMRHYRSVCRIRHSLRQELRDVKEIMDAVGPHCKDLLLNVDVEVIGEWLVNLDKSRSIVAEVKEAVCPRIDLEIGNTAPGFGDWGLCVPSPTQSEMSMERLFRRYRLPACPLPSNRTSAAITDINIDQDLATKKKKGRNYIRASLLALN